MALLFCSSYLWASNRVSTKRSLRMHAGIEGVRQSVKLQMPDASRPIVTGHGDCGPRLNSKLRQTALLQLPAGETHLKQRDLAACG